MGCERVCLWHEFRNARIPSSAVLLSMSEGTICDKFGHPVLWANQQESKRRFQICFDSAVRFNSGHVSPQKWLQLNQALTHTSPTYSTECLMIWREVEVCSALELNISPSSYLLPWVGESYDLCYFLWERFLACNMGDDMCDVCVWYMCANMWDMWWASFVIVRLTLRI